MYEKSLYEAINAYEKMTSSVSVCESDKPKSKTNGKFAVSMIGGKYLHTDGWKIELVDDIKNANSFDTVEEAKGFLDGIITMFQKSSVAKA